MKKSVFSRAIVALLFVIATVFAGVTPASASAPDIAVGSLNYFARAGQSIDTQMHPTFTINNFSGTPTFSISPALPSGLTLNTSTGEVTGTPTVGLNPTTFTVTATHNSESDSASFVLAVGESITVNSTVSSVSPSVANASSIVLTFGHTSIINNANGVITVVLQNATPTTPGSCTGVNLSPSATSCSLTLNGSTYSYQFTGVDFSNPSSTFTMTFTAGTLTAGTNGMFGLNVNLTNDLNESSLNYGAPGIQIGSGQNQQQQNQSTPFTAGTAVSSRGSSPSFATLAVGANSPAYTSTFSGFSNGAIVDQVNFLLGDPVNGIFWSVPGAVTNNGSNYATWNPSSNTCGISAIRIGGVAQTASSGITCLKSTAATTPVQYWISFKLSTPTSSEISYDVAPGAFVVTQAGNYNYYTTLFDNSTSPRKLSSTSQAFDATPQSQSTPADLVSFSLPVAVGQRIVGEDVAIAATDLAVSTDYSVVLRSTPQILAQGRTVSSSFNTSVTIPDNLEPGWHSITFSATRSDGSALEEKVYFKINEDGTLLASSTDVPAELALTGVITAGAVPLSLIVLMLGFVAFFVAREINPDFMRVMTLTRNEDGELDFVKRRIRSVDF